MDEVTSRKGEHLAVVASMDVNTRASAGWSDVRLIHQALPEIDLDEVDPGVTFLGRQLRYPLAIASMTGGHEEALAINQVLAQAAEAFGLAMGVGSQRAALRDPRLRSTYSVVRDVAPTAFIIGNVGAPQLIDQGSGGPLGAEDLREIIEMIRADAVAVHLNYLEEVVQPEGDRRARGCRTAIAALAQESPVPLIGKETGAGLSREAAHALRDAGLAALDVGGVGGTSFAAVEGYRAAAHGDRRGKILGEVFRDWGIPAAVSVVQARTAGLPVIATGGIRTGLDAARALALGATLVGVARPLLFAAMEGYDSVERWLRQFVAELQAALFLTGSRTIADLHRRRTVIVGETLEWLRQLGDETGPDGLGVPVDETG